MPSRPSSVPSVPAEDAGESPGSEAGRLFAPRPGFDPSGTGETRVTLAGEEIGPESGAKLGRFELGGLLGEGGMGRVYAAEDPHLHRQVAIKLLRRDDPAAVQRFVREAHAQAGVSHPGICPVFEVGEVDGLPYIVMARLRGERLDRAAAGLPLEKKLVLVRQVVEAVHAAHRTGLVHRDLKPSNVLVERSDDGDLHPFVLDFGLARQPSDAAALTQEGEVVGTPCYMAPEQALGEVERIDRRSDVYALGATLYHLLSGKPPFPGKGTSTLIRVLYDEPPPLRSAGVPRDVEAIVFKCLEKDPARRYGSAKAFAEDLGRYLDGSAVEARPAGRLYRLRKWLERNRLTAAVVAVAAALLAGAIAWGAYASWSASQRESLVRELTEKVEEIEALVRYSQMSPPHDVRPDRLLLRQRMSEIRRRMESSGRLGRNAGHYALGRGLLALEDLEPAHRHLQAAWDGGLRRPEVASALARTLSALYRRGLLEAERVRDWQTRQDQLHRLEKRYGDPASLLLERTPGAATETFLAALVPFHRGRFEAALEVLEKPSSRRPWSYELEELEGDIRRTWAVALATGGDLDTARRQFENAAEAYARAIAVAPSAPHLYRAAAQLSYQRSSLDGSTGADLGTQLDTGLDAARKALEVDPGDAEAWLWKARLHLASVREILNRAEDPSPQLRRAIEAARRATTLDDRSDVAWLELGRAHAAEARWKAQRQQDPLEDLEAATAAFDHIDEGAKDYELWVFLGQVEAIRGDHLASRGDGAAETYHRAASAFRAGLEQHSEPFAAWFNLGSTLLKLVAVSSRAEAPGVLEQARHALERAAALRPDHVAPLIYLGHVLHQTARLATPRAPGFDPALEGAIDNYRRAAEMVPEMFQAQVGLEQALQLKARAAWDRGEDPAPLFEDARRAAKTALELAPESRVATLNLTWLDYFEAKLRLRSGEDPGPWLRSAEGALSPLLAAGRTADVLLALASIRRLEAEWAVLEGAAAQRLFDAARSLLDEILAESPGHAEANRCLGRLLTLEAARLAHRGEDPSPRLGLARRALDRSANTLDDEYQHLAEARWALVAARTAGRAAGLDRDQLLALGERRAQGALELRPGWPEARVVLGALRLERGEAGAAELLRRAYEANPRLRGRSPTGTALDLESAPAGASSRLY